MRRLRTPRFTLTVTTGSEGPDHDPYAFTEYDVRFHGPHERRVGLHLGLAEWLRLNGDDAPGELVAKHGYDGLFAILTGFHPGEVERWFNKLASRCRECGCKRGEWADGYPGESFLLCARCHNVMDHSFNENAIL